MSGVPRNSASPISTHYPDISAIDRAPGIRDRRKETFKSPQFATIGALAAALKEKPIPHVAPVLAVEVDEENGCTHVYTPQFSESLDQFVQKSPRISSATLKRWAIQMLSALRDMDEMALVHGRISQYTIFIDGDDLVLTDCLYCYDPNSEETYPTFACMAWEMLHRNECSHLSDVFSVARILLYAATGQTPVNLKQYDITSESFRHLLELMTPQNPTKRSSAAQLLSIIHNVLDDGPQYGFVRKLSLGAVVSVKKLFSKERHAQLQEDYKFSLREKCDEARCYEAMVAISSTLEDPCRQLTKLEPSDFPLLLKIGKRSVFAGTCYQQEQLRDYALYCYFRAMLAFKLAKCSAAEKLEAKRMMKVAYFNFMALQKCG